MKNDNNNNVIPIKKFEHFGVYLGEVTSDGEIIEGESVGIAFLRNGSQKFQLKLFVFPGLQYFIVPDENNNKKYVILSLEEYKTAAGQQRKNWNQVGEGRLVGNFIGLRIQLLPENLFLCLFPDKQIKEDAASSSTSKEVTNE